MIWFLLENWETCSRDGSFSLLPINEKIKINNLYTKINNYNYEAKGVANKRDEVNKASPQDKDNAYLIWVAFTERLRKIADDLKNDAEAILRDVFSEQAREKH